MFKKGQLVRGCITKRHAVVIDWPVARFVDGLQEKAALVAPYWRLVGNNYKEKPRD